jgi:hypothetical protein
LCIFSSGFLCSIGFAAGVLVLTDGLPVLSVTFDPDEGTDVAVFETTTVLLTTAFGSTFLGV